MKTAEAANGKWRSILLALGIEEKYLTGKHGPCPFCGGRDRFRWDNQNGDGGYVCGQCGAGNGFNFAMGVLGLTFPEAAKRVDEVVGNAVREPVKAEPDEATRRERMNRLWKGASPLQPGDFAFGYLDWRNCLPDPIPKCLRFHPECPAPDGVKRPALLALVTDADGKPASIHRTFLNGERKADMSDPRAIMPGKLPDGVAVRLAPAGDVLGIAEGIETACHASIRFGVPVWSAINSTMLAKWTPPAGVRKVMIFGDNDDKFGGQLAAYSLAVKCKVRLKLEVEVHIPGKVGTDWAD